MSNVKKWLKYYRNCIVDSDRKPVLFNSQNRWIEQNLYSLSVPPNIVQKLFYSAGNLKSIEVDIAPVMLTPEYDHGKKEEKDSIYPFIIHANLSKGGELYPLKDRKPTTVRDYLSPNPEGEWVFSDVKKVDSLLSNFEFNYDNWDKYLGSCLEFLKRIKEEEIKNFCIDEEFPVHIARSPVRNTALNITKFLDSVLLKNSFDYPLLTSALTPDQDNVREFSLKTDSPFDPLHSGQMNGDFPLAKSQRDAVLAYNCVESGKVHSVTGPPGTGKTTLLQSIIATEIVRAVSEEREPPLIMACSANNQAITNIVDSFELKSADKLDQRWLPNIKTFGVQFTGKNDKDAKEGALRFDIFSSGELISGFSPDEDFIRELTSHFLSEFSEYLKKDVENLDEAMDQLRSAVKEKESEIAHLSGQIVSIQDCASAKESFLGQKQKSDWDEYRTELLQSSDKLTAEIEMIKDLSDEVRSETEKMNFMDSLLAKLNIDIKYRLGKINQLLTEELKLENIKDIGKLLTGLDGEINARKKEVDLTEAEISEMDKLQNSFLQAESAYENSLDSWNVKYGHKLEELYKYTGDEYRNLDRFGDLNVRLDISSRFEAFWLAVHFREGDYIKRLAEKSHGLERHEETYRKKLQRMACLTPVFISTFFSLPRYSNYFSPETRSEQYYQLLYDLLIVDEAGQVPPEISLPAFIFAKKSVVVGDTKQIEPVFSINDKIDYSNMKLCKLVSNESEFLKAAEQKMTASSGNLMQVAENCAPYKYEDSRGNFLREHRRCLDQIIEFSDKYVYGGKLIPKVGKNKPTGLLCPSVGYMHIDTKSEDMNGSRVNSSDAETVAKWIARNQENWLQTYPDKKLSQTVAVVTPYREQANLIRTKLRNLKKTHIPGIDPERVDYGKITCGTVHSLQGAERPIIIFSTVLSEGDSTVFLGNSYNMLNVAVSRARHSFQVIGNMNAVNPKNSDALGDLGKWLFSDDENILDSEVYYSDKSHFQTANQVIEDNCILNDPDRHQKALLKSFVTAEKNLIIVSPFLSSKVVGGDDFLNALKSAVSRDVAVTVYTDAKLDMKFERGQTAELKKYSHQARKMLMDNGAKLVVLENIHNKNIMIDDKIFILGSFNWLSAVRDKDNPYHRHENSVILKGEGVSNKIEAELDILESLPKYNWKP